MKHVPILALIAIAVTAGIVGCSGGGSSTPGPDRTPNSAATGNGQGGSTAPLDQTVAFTIVVPSPAPSSASAASRVKRQSVLGPYISPNVGSILIQLQTVDGQPFRNPPTPYPAININCPNGCMKPVPGLPAARGLDGFSVETFTGSNGSGSVISTGSVFVTLPSATAATLPGTSLALGGFAANVRLAFVQAVPFTLGAASTGTLAYNAIDPTGALIVGNPTLLNNGGLTFSLVPNGSLKPLTFSNGGVTATSSQASGTIPISYTGAATQQISVVASLTDENGQPVSLTLPVPVALPTAPATKPPGPVPMGSPLSLYVYDGLNNAVLEYDGVRGIEAGSSPNPMQTPKRAFTVAAIPADACYGGGSVNVAGLGVDGNGKIYTSTACTNSTTGVNSNYVYDANTIQLSSPPPPVTNLTNGTMNASDQAVEIDAANNAYFYYTSSNYAPEIDRFALPSGTPPPLGGNGTLPVGVIGSGCFTPIQLGTPIPCDPAGFGSGNPNDFGALSQNFAIDPNGTIYLPGAYGTAAPEPLASQIPGGLTQFEVSTFGATGTVPNPSAINALSGVTTQLGSTASAFPPAVAYDRGWLYTLDTAFLNGETFDMNQNPLTYTYAGLSDCAAPNDVGSATALTACADGNPHVYIAGYSPTAVTQLGQAAGANGDFGAAPDFVVGGDGLGAGFGQFDPSSQVNGSSSSIAFNGFPNGFTVIDGFAFVLNEFPLGSMANPPEIDIYNLNSLQGTGLSAGLTTVPFAKLIFSHSAGTAYAMPVAIAIGAPGNAAGLGGIPLTARSMSQIRARYQAFVQGRARAFRTSRFRRR